MPLSGGATDKFGNRYEGRWTVYCMVEVMNENAASIRLEPPGDEGEGVEFWIGKENHREYHQVKRQYSKGSWTLSALNSKRILSDFWEKLRVPSAICTFVSTDRAYQLDELADRARRSESFEEFEQEFLNASNPKPSEKFKEFQELCSYWNECSQIEAYETLRQICVKTVSEDFLLSVVL